MIKSSFNYWIPIICNNNIGQSCGYVYKSEHYEPDDFLTNSYDHIFPGVSKYISMLRYLYGTSDDFKKVIDCIFKLYIKLVNMDNNYENIICNMRHTVNMYWDKNNIRSGTYIIGELYRNGIILKKDVCKKLNYHKYLQDKLFFTTNELLCDDDYKRKKKLVKIHDPLKSHNKALNELVIQKSINCADYDNTFHENYENEEDTIVNKNRDFIKNHIYNTQNEKKLSEIMDWKKTWNNKYPCYTTYYNNTREWSVKKCRHCNKYIKFTFLCDMFTNTYSIKMYCNLCEDFDLNVNKDPINKLLCYFETIVVDFWKILRKNNIKYLPKTLAQVIKKKYISENKYKLLKSSKLLIITQTSNTKNALEMLITLKLLRRNMIKKANTLFKMISWYL